MLRARRDASRPRSHAALATLRRKERELVAAFGPRRVFWGTDLTRMPCSYYECISLFTHHMPWLSGEDLEWVMGRGVCEWLGWHIESVHG